MLVGSYRLRALPIDRELAYGVRRNAVLQKLTSYPLATFVCDDKQHHKLMAVDVRESPEALRLLLRYDEAQGALEGKRYVCQNSLDPMMQETQLSCPYRSLLYVKELPDQFGSSLPTGNHSHRLLSSLLRRPCRVRFKMTLGAYYCSLR